LNGGAGAQISGFVNSSVGNGGVTGGVFGSTATTASSTIGLTGGAITVNHAFGPSLAADVFQVQVSITNNTGATVSNLVYRRVMDWDVPPTEFAEFVTHSGVVANLVSNGGNLQYASDNGFASANPLVGASSIAAGTVNTDFTDSGPDDHGSVFDFAFGDLNDGATRIFNIFYGSSSSEAGALSAVAQLGVDLYSLGQNSAPGGATTGTPATFLFAFGGVGGVEPGEIPEVPILPFVPAPGEFDFPAPQPRRWFDPPFADGFIYTLAGGATFTEVGTPPSSFGFGDVGIYDASGSTLFTMLAPGGTYDFAGHLGLSSFSIRGIGPALDIAAPGFSSAFPAFLDWTGTATSLHMSAILTTTPPEIPEPGTFGLLSIAVGFIAWRVRRKR
jgi:hypothetical protein